MILYVSESGGMVTKEYEGTPYEEADNLVVAKIVADAWGCTVALLGRATTMYNDTPVGCHVGPAPLALFLQM